MAREGYDKAQVCLNGHVTNSVSLTEPNHNKKFCDECGSPTISECPDCNAPIKGSYHYPGMPVIGFGFVAPKFCDNCGNAFSWTITKMQVAKELSELSETLTIEEIIDLNENIKELVQETAKVPIAQIKVKRYMQRIGNDISDGIHDALMDIISETIQNSIWAN